MRVRYGKPIKVKSTYSDYFSSGTNAYRCSKVVENGIATLTKTSDDYATLYKDMTPTSGHTYFYYCKQRVLDTVGSNDRLNLSVNATSGYNQNVVAPTVNEWYEFYGKSNVTGNFIRFEPRCYAANGIKFQLTTPITIDLTEIGLDNLTAQEFYNKYNKYFSLITTGEEITIDDKAGQIAGDILYGYNQICELTTRTSGPITFTPNDNYGLTITGSIPSGGDTRYYTYSLNLSHKYYYKIIAESTISTIDWYCGDTYLFLNDNRIQELINQPTNAGLNINVRAGFTGPFNIQIEAIDLTDWYGAGNEPATVQEFKEKFSKEFYGYRQNVCRLTRNQIEALPNYGYNQLVKNGNFVDTSCWSPTYGTITMNDNICTYTITQVGTVDSNQNRINYIQSWQTNLIAQHKFLFMSEIYCKYAQNLSFIVHDRSNGYRGIISTSKRGVANSWNEFSAIMTAQYDCLASNADMRIGFSSTSDSAIGDKYYAKNFILVDLTDWYGAGNEPSTVQEFRQTFPNKYYQYSQKSLLNKYMINYNQDISNNIMLGKVAGGSSGTYCGYNQLFNCIKTTNSNGTIAFDNTGIYTYTFGSTIASNAYTNVVVDETVGFIPGNKYLLMRYIKAPYNGKFYCRYQNYSQQIDVTANTWVTDNNIVTATSGGSVSSYIGPSNPSEQGYVQGDSYQVRHQIINLTEWFGANKEPSTVQEFKEKFTKDYYGFCPTAIKLTRYQIEALPSYGYNQLFKVFQNFTAPAGTTKTLSSDNLSVTITGTSTNGINTMLTPQVSGQTFIEGHKYLGLVTLNGTVDMSNDGWSFRFGRGSQNILRPFVQNQLNTFNNDIKSIFFTYLSNDSLVGLYSYFSIGSTYNITISNPMLIDLTDWYGAGNEPTTMEEFKSTFPNKYYPYSKKRLLNKYMINKLIN